MTENKFIRKSISLQIGGYQGPIAQGEAALIRGLQRSSPMAIAYRPELGQAFALAADGTSLQRVRANKLPPKTAGALASLYAKGTAFDFIIDMQDRRAKRISPDGLPTVPVFSFNRLQGDSGRILLPLPGYHDFGNGQFGDAVQPDAVAWAEKQSCVIWRGATGGRAALDENGLAEGMRLKTAFRQLRKGKMTEAALMEVVKRAPRWALLNRVQNDRRFDLGFVDHSKYQIAQTPLHAHLERPRMLKSNMQFYRYIAVLRGQDVGSSFYWVMNSGSLGFVMDTPYETFASGHFQPEEAYLKFKMDGSDIAEKFEWAEAHPAEVQAMVERAQSISALVLQAELRDKILSGIVERIASLPQIFDEVAP